MAKLPNATATDLQLCKTLPYNQLAANKCDQVNGPALCAPGTSLGRNVTVEKITYAGISCPNQGCIPTPDGSVLKCKKAPTNTP